MKVEGAIFVDSSTSNTEDAAGSCTETFAQHEVNKFSNDDTNITHRVEVQKLTAQALRGILHAPCSRVISCVMGEVFVVVVDLRPESVTFRYLLSVHVINNLMK